MTGDALSVVICTFNRADSLRRALETVIRQEPGTFSTEVVVVDDGSMDHTRQVVEELAQNSVVPVRYVREDSKAGIAVARNRGVNEAQGAWVVFFDDDQLADPDWLKQLMAVAEEKSAALVGGARKLDVPEDQLFRLGPVCRAVLGENVYPPQPEKLCGKDLPTTGNLLISKKVFETAGMFDTSLVSSGEDADLIHRARRAGFEIWTAPRAMVAHMIPQYRLESAYFRWVSLRWGNQFARFDAKRGKPRLAAAALARMGQALLIHAPKLLAVQIRRDTAKAMDMKCLLWRATGYVRTAAVLIAPGLFPQKKFLADLEFRSERELFTKA
ncbi:MAG TPA: glycosyltransferase family 2 protein [Candidatus Hydrogenedentes bacterium]|nr:glycosyltransferase family 2 protein [Candidatus Hydrogenedentota bacterium]